MRKVCEGCGAGRPMKEDGVGCPAVGPSTRLFELGKKVLLQVGQ